MSEFMQEMMEQTATHIGQGQQCAQATPEYIARNEVFVKNRQLYLDFAKEVLGWASVGRQDHRLFNQGEDDKLCVLAPDILENVIEHVAGWCDVNGTGFSVAYGNTTDLRLGDPDYSVFINGFESTNNSLPIALIEACLEAAREQKEDV
jgi:hypothetical protein